MASARSLVTTRCSWPCRPMRWYGPVPAFPPLSRLILRVLDPLLQLCWDLLWVWEIHQSTLAVSLHRNQAWTSPLPPPQVDKHIRRLDTDLARFEADLKEKQIESSDYDSSSSKGKKSEEGGGAVRCGQSQREKRPTAAVREQTVCIRDQENLTHLFVSAFRLTLSS